MASGVERTNTVEFEPVHLTLGSCAPPNSQPNPVDCHTATGAEDSMKAEGVFSSCECDSPACNTATTAPSTDTEVLFVVATICRRSCPPK